MYPKSNLIVNSEFQCTCNVKLNQIGLFSISEPRSCYSGSGQVKMWDGKTVTLQGM